MVRIDDEFGNFISSNMTKVPWWAKLFTRCIICKKRKPDIVHCQFIGIFAFRSHFHDKCLKGYELAEDFIGNLLIRKESSLKWQEPKKYFKEN